ncbi:hypothetical protein DEO72_LG8g2307 [Vigna unguiculata]|uniref:Uncharacterized protein n=1 Tax=Vigna unguiculata TaxID=3917 RepID=A0A4D6MUK5_VIGUN|nr:hypothetical protein DEO72_LG8g2307 [Vigna unguiculata]
MPLALSSLLCFTVSIGSGDLFFDFAQVNDKDEEKSLIDGGRCIEYEEGKFLCVNDSLRGCEHDEGSEWREGWRWKPNGDGGDFGGTVVLRMGEIKVECEAHDLWLWMGDESVNNGEAKKIMVMFGLASTGEGDREGEEKRTGIVWDELMSKHPPLHLSRHQHAATGHASECRCLPTRRPHLCSIAPAGRERRRRRRSQLTGDTPLFSSFFYAQDPFSIASSHHDSRSQCRCRNSHGRRGTPPSTPATNGSIAGENPTPRIVSFLVSPPAREMAVIASVIRHRRASHTATRSANVNDKDEEKRLIDGGRVCDGGGSEWREGWRWKPNGDGGDFGGTVVLRMGEIKVECEAHDLWLWMGDESVNNGEAKKIMVMFGLASTGEGDREGEEKRTGIVWDELMSKHVPSSSLKQQAI